jgi:hypothetical protein
MRWKQCLTPLDDVPGLDSHVWATLLKNHITTAEELVGQIEAEPGAVGELLKMSAADVQELGRQAYEVIDPDTAAAIAGQRGRERSLGALPPDDQAD